MMKKFELITQKIWFGPFEPCKINVSLFFQLNCPACFMYAFPLMDLLYERFKKADVGFIAISTAFEDFEINNTANTKLFVYENRLFGNTLSLFERTRTMPYEFKRNFPVAMDLILVPNKFLTEENIQKICDGIPDFAIWPDFEKKAMKQKIKEYYRKMPKVASMFNILQLRGTPTFIFFDKDMNIKNTVFGMDEFDDKRYSEYLEEQLSN